MRIWTALCFSAPAVAIVREHGQLGALADGDSANNTNSSADHGDDVEHRRHFPSRKRRLKKKAGEVKWKPVEVLPDGDAALSMVEDLSSAMNGAKGKPDKKGDKKKPDDDADKKDEGSDTGDASNGDDDKGDVLKTEEEALEKVEKEVEEDAAEAAEGTGKAVGEVVGDVLGEGAALGKDVIEGNATAVERDVKQEVGAMFFELRPCTPDDLSSCAKKMVLATALVAGSYAVFIFAVAGRRLTKGEALKKEAFTGDMKPIELKPCPGGAGSKLCLAAYFCNCWLRLATLAKLEGWDAKARNVNSLLCVFMFALFHIVSVTFVASIGFGAHNMQDISALGLLSAPVTMALFGYRLATWRVIMKQKGSKAEEKPAVTPHEILVSAYCAPCAGGQEVEFMEKYEEAHAEGDQGWFSVHQSPVKW